MPTKMDTDIWTEMDKLGLNPFAFDDDTMDFVGLEVGNNIENNPSKSVLDNSLVDMKNVPTKWNLNL